MKKLYKSGVIIVIGELTQPGARFRFSTQNQTWQLTCIREVGQVLDDELECAVGGRVLGLDELRLQDHEVHEDVAGGDQGVAASGGKVVIKCDQ